MCQAAHCLAFPLPLGDQGADSRKCGGGEPHNPQLGYLMPYDLVNYSLPAPVLQLRRNVKVLILVPRVRLCVHLPFCMHMSTHTGLGWRAGVEERWSTWPCVSGQQGPPRALMGCKSQCGWRVL
jgi:hypothetical protein